MIDKVKKALKYIEELYLSSLDEEEFTQLHKGRLIIAFATLILFIIIFCICLLIW